MVVSSIKLSDEKVEEYTRYYYAMITFIDQEIGKIRKELEKKESISYFMGSFANFLLVIFKFLAGIAGHSAAMMADAVHSLSDFVTDVVVILFVRISNKPQDKGHDYGHGKYETLVLLDWSGTFGSRLRNLMERCRRNLGLYARRTVACARSACTDCGSCLYLIEGDIVSIHCPYGQKVQLSSSDCQCMASSERCIVFYRNGFRYWRSYSARSSLGGARPYCRRDSQFLYNESVCQALGPLY